MEPICRCRWCNPRNPLYVAYHDQEWGAPQYDDGKLFELLVLESFQAGLSWETILNKRESFRSAFGGFIPERVAAYGETETAALLENKSIVRKNRRRRSKRKGLSGDPARVGQLLPLHLALHRRTSGL